MVTFPMTLADSYPGFQGHGIFEVNYLKKKRCVLGYGHSYYCKG